MEPLLKNPFLSDYKDTFLETPEWKVRTKLFPNLESEMWYLKERIAADAKLGGIEASPL